MLNVKNFKNSVLFYAASILVFVSGLAVAGTWVSGYGSTRADAVRDTEQRARELADKKGTCFNRVEASNCKNDGDGWICKTTVANHKGSCSN